jgi:hypothetical protein
LAKKYLAKIKPEIMPKATSKSSVIVTRTSIGIIACLKNTISAYWKVWDSRRALSR